MKSASFAHTSPRLIAALALSLASASASAQTNNYFGTSGALSGNVWSTNPSGPFTSALNTTGGAIINFNNTATFNGGSITVAGINASANATVGSISGTITNLSNGVIPISVSNGATLDFGSQAFTTSATAGYTKSGNGVLALAGAGFGGGFTLNSGTVIARGVNAMGNNTLTLNGGIVAANNNRDLSGKYVGGITVGGNVQFGEISTNVALSNNTSNLTFSNNVSLGSSSRTLTLGNGGTMTFSGVISNTGSGGITFAATSNGSGRFDVSNSTNTFAGPINITGGEVRFTGDGSLGNNSNSIVIDGGRFSKASDATTVTLGASRTISIGNSLGTSISSPGTGTLIYNGTISDISGKTGSWAKQGGGTLQLGGVSTYTGDTAINNGIVKLTTGANRLPTGTTISVGQAASTNLGTLDLNGQNQQVAGLNSVSGTNASVSDNTITSATAATLTLGGSGTYSFGDSTPANSGVLTGSLAVVKSGSGTQTFGDANTFSGGTTVSNGTLVAAHTNALGTGGLTVSGGTLEIGNAAAASLTFALNKSLSLSGGSIKFDLGTSSDQIVGSGNGTVSFSGSTITIVQGSGFSYNSTYQLFSGFSSVGGTALFSGYDNTNYTAQLGSNGLLTFVSAIPEPSSFAALAGLAALGLGATRRRRA